MQTDSTVLALWQPYRESTSFRFSIRGYNCTLGSKRQTEILESFSWMDLRGPIVMNEPELEVCVWEDWAKAQTERDSGKHEERRSIWIGKKVKWICSQPLAVLPC